MSITDRVEQTLTTDLVERKQKVEFTALRDFYEAMQRAGVAQKQPYSLPPLDTAGKRLRQITVHKNSR